MDGEPRRPSLGCSVATVGRPARLVRAEGEAARLQRQLWRWASTGSPRTSGICRPTASIWPADAEDQILQTRGPETPAGQKGK
jgi:hypothetical protein